MRAAPSIAFSTLLVACGEQGAIDYVEQTPLKDTAFTSIEKRGDLFIEHYYSYDSLGHMDFETAHVTAYDTISSVLKHTDRRLGTSFKFDNYDIWTTSVSLDTFEVLTSLVRKGEFLCFQDTVLVDDALVIERRTEGYGTYRNAGFLVVPSRRDTIPIWSLVDRGLPQPHVWNWDGLVPMTFEEYQSWKLILEKDISSLLSKNDLDSLLNRAQ